jgi:hypothetical protein
MLAYFSTLKMEAIYSCETTVDFQRTTWRYIPEDVTLGSYFIAKCIFLNYLHTITDWINRKVTLGETHILIICIH